MDGVSVDDLAARGSGHLPGLLGIEFDHGETGRVMARLDVRPELFAPNGYLHAATVVGLADTACGYGTVLSLPDGAAGFTTIELKANFVGTARTGTITVDARLTHGGRTIQFWQATVARADGVQIAHFAATNLIIYPR